MRRVGHSAATIASCAALLVAAGAFLAGACGGATLGSTSVASCRSSSDCPSGQSCQFSVYQSCGAPGACLPSLDGTACLPQLACSCTGATETVCLVNGNSPSPVESIGSCDGASTQQPFPSADAGKTGAPDSSSPPPPPPTDSGPTSEDTGSPPQSDDSGTAPDADDGSTGTLLGVPCTSAAQCSSDPIYNMCEDVAGQRICTATCFTSADCQPPANGHCDTGVDYCELQ